jgi:uncharacterized protein (DUF488 family)
MNPVPDDRSLWTIGHSNRDLDTFLTLLNQSAIKLVADIRRFPASRAHPHFNQSNLAAALAEHGISYRHFPELGGRRSQRLPDSPNHAWEVQAFNAYADHMQSDEFLRGIESLTEVAARERCVIMCSEAVPWRCHRRLVSDYLLAHGWTVYDIMSDKRVTPHAMTKFAKIVDGQVIYPEARLF